MNKPEKYSLLKWLQEQIDDPNRAPGLEFLSAAYKICRSHVLDMPITEGWLSVKEALPDYSGKDYDTIVCKYRNGGTATIKIAGENRISPGCVHITHWMPLPKLPKEDPFEEWWNAQDPSNWQNVVGKSLAKRSWIAATEHASKEGK